MLLTWDDSLSFVAWSWGQPLYVHTESNHPPTVIKQLPISIDKRLSEISSTEADFQAASPQYQAALNASGYSHTLSYCKPSSDKVPRQQSQRKVNKRRVIWFNPSFSKGVKTNFSSGQEALPAGLPIVPCLQQEHYKALL